MSSLLATKLHRPSLSPQRVQRPHLVQRLNQGLSAGHKLTLVSAPAGFGKTTCICEWLNSLDRWPVAWLSLDPADNDPGRFFTYLLAALQKVDTHAILGGEVEDVFHSAQLPPSEVIATTLLNALMAFPDRFLLVLDDFHVIQESFILRVMEQLVASLPPALHLVLLTREDPALPLGRLRAHDQLTEIRSGDLRFSSREADGLLNGWMGLTLSTDDLAALEERTEGWVVGLQLAGLSMRGRPDPSEFIAALSGSHRFILSYLTEEVLSRQPEEIQQFLLETSILDKLSGDLCNAVTGRTDSHVQLERLFAANLFLIPLDDDGQWYRYHHLFADLLRNRLRQTLPVNTVQELHYRASDWLAQNDYIDEAVQHALEGKDYERAVSFVERVARKMMYTGRVNVLRKWLEALPEPSFETHPHLKIYRVWIDLLQGRIDFSEEAMQETDKKLNALPPSPENDQLRVELIVILGRFMALSGSPSRGIRYGQEALRSLPEGDLASRARVHSTLAIAYGMEGNAEKAETAYHECLRLAQSSGYYTLAAHTMMLMGTWLCHYGQLHEATRTFQSIVDLGAKSGQRIFFPAGQGLIGLASIYLEQNDLENAEGCLKQGIELCSQGGLDGLITGWIVKSRLRQARGDLAGALEDIHLLEQSFPRTDIAFSLTIRQIQVRLALEDLESASRWAVPLMEWLNSETARARTPVVILEMLEAIVVRVYLAQGEIERALRLLGELQASAEPGRRFGRLIEVHLLRALAYQKQTRGTIPPEARASLEHALDLAEPEGYVLLFVEEGPQVISLLNAVSRDPAAPERLRKYAAKLLDAFPQEARASTAPNEEPLRFDEMIEPLTSRELDVLRLMAEGLKYEEIAERLFISLNTVRTYVKGIYGKLNVNNRTQAITLAQQQKMI